MFNFFKKKKVEPKKPKRLTWEEKIIAWPEDESNQLIVRDSRLQKLKAEMEKNELNIKFIGTCCSSLATWNTTSGAAKVLQGTSNGWEEVNLGLYLKFYFLKIALNNGNISDNNENSIVFHGDAFLTYFLAKYLNQNKIVEWLGENIVRSKNNKAFGNWTKSETMWFAYSLHLLKSNKDFDHLEKLGVYKDVYLELKDGKELSNESILKVCKFHQKRRDLSEKHLSDFCEYPYPVFPVELLAVNKDIKVDHPLFKNNLSIPPQKPLEEPENKILTDVKKLLIENNLI